MTYPPESLPIPEKTRFETLRENFCGIFDESKRNEAEELFKKIAEEYQAETREYHNFEHIEKMLSFLHTHEQEIKDAIGVKLAIFFHDIVYDTKAKNNEEQSAQYAQISLIPLGIPEDVVNHALALIRSTAKHEVENDTDMAIFLDADLAILGSNEDDYDKYAAKIRKEYAWVSDEQYKTGRTKVLKSFLERSRIYLTEKAYKELEQQARTNIGREIAGLS